MLGRGARNSRAPDRRCRAPQSRRGHRVRGGGDVASPRPTVRTWRAIGRTEERSERDTCPPPQGEGLTATQRSARAPPASAASVSRTNSRRHQSPMLARCASAARIGEAEAAEIGVAAQQLAVGRDRRREGGVAGRRPRRARSGRPPPAARSAATLALARQLVAQPQEAPARHRRAALRRRAGWPRSAAAAASRGCPPARSRRARSPGGPAPMSPASTASLSKSSSRSARFS